MMSNTLIILIYLFTAYGFSNMMVFGSGPFKIFERIREGSSNINSHFGTLFACMMCFPANVGLFSSIIDWFFLGAIAITPFNILLSGTNLWWLAILGDCCLTSGAVWIIHNIESFFESIATGTSNIQQEENNDDIIDIHE
jgi:hypothetical protein